MKKKEQLDFFILNRFCFNGVYRTNKNGQFNVPYGTRTGGFPKKEIFEDASLKLQSAELFVGDYYNILKKVSPNDFVYIDPPYSKSGRFSGEYGLGSFKQNDLPRLQNFLSSLNNIGAKFLFSYFVDQDLLKSFANCYHTEKVQVRRHVAGFKKNWDTEI